MDKDNQEKSEKVKESSTISRQVQILQSMQLWPQNQVIQILKYQS